MELWSFLLYISLTIDSKFHIPSGSRPGKLRVEAFYNILVSSILSPLSGRRKDDHSAALGGAVVER